MTVLEVKNIIKKFDEFTAVNDISFELNKGEILGILGPNGAGKTTTIQMLLGLLTADSGSIHYFGKELNQNRQEILEKINFSSTYINFPWELTVNESLKYISYLYDINNRKKRIDEITELFNIQSLLNKKISELSEGQKTKVNLAKSFLNHPEILLLDEPTASLDPDTADEVRKLILDSREKYGMSLIFTSHNMAEIEEVCDRVIFMKDGKLLSNDTPRNLARTVNISHIKFMPADFESFINYCKKEEYKFSEESKYIIIDIQENLIAKLLNNMAQNGIKYTEISIIHPSLEDYFISISRDINEAVTI